MGSPAQWPGGDAPVEQDEQPQQEIILEPFFLAKYELTQAQWVRMTGENPSRYQPGSGELGRITVTMTPPARPGAPYPGPRRRCKTLNRE